MKRIGFSLALVISLAFLPEPAWSGASQVNGRSNHVKGQIHHAHEVKPRHVEVRTHRPHMIKPHRVKVRVHQPHMLKSHRDASKRHGHFHRHRVHRGFHRGGFVVHVGPHVQQHGAYHRHFAVHGGPGRVWVAGFWHWSGVHWVWVPGHWVVPSHGLPLRNPCD